MPNRLHLLGLLLCVCLAAAEPRHSFAQPPPTSQPLPVWMTGCWSGERGRERFTERWIAADAATLIGTSHTVKGGALSAFEFLRVVLKAGVPVYVAQPSGVPPTEFTATGQTAAEITFANPAHDFPKRIGYKRVDATHLTAWIDGGVPSSTRLEFPMTRVSCEP